MSSSNFNATLLGSDESLEELLEKAAPLGLKANSSVPKASGKHGKLSAINENAEGGATCMNYYDEAEEGSKDDSISANFDFGDDNPDGSEDSEIQVLPQNGESKTKSKPVKSVIVLDSLDHEISMISQKLKKLPFDQQVAKMDALRKAIVLDEAPPIERKTYTYDSTTVKHQEFYGNAQKTVKRLAKTIEEMPMPDDEESKNITLPRGLIPLFDHQSYGLIWLSWREREFPGGGILADEMGLGKTIMIIALIMKSREETAQGSDENWVNTEEVGSCIPSKTTLVVGPVSCLNQWYDEISKKGRGLRVMQYHGRRRSEISAEDLADCDIILTSYQTLNSDMKTDGTNGSPLKRLYWKRIILDEAHYIRNPTSACAISVCKLKSRHRWAVTGTPIHNKPEDFYSVAKFLRFAPFDDAKVWDSRIGMKKVRESATARRRLHILTKALILRRTKDEVQKAGGNVKRIPPKTVEIIELDLSESEKQVNEYFTLLAKKMFNKFMADKDERELNAATVTYTADRHKKKVSSREDNDDLPTDIKFSHLFTLLMRLRQCAVLPHLIHTMLEDEEIDEDVSFDESNENHVISKKNPCFDRLYESTKFLRILADLDTLKQQAETKGKPMDKVIIVSSWTSSLEILNEHLTRRRFSCVFITGKEKNTERADNMKKFNNHPKKYHICLLSLLAGGVGLNLVGGNYIFFVEPHWNPQLELLAQDRVHRFGQTKDVVVRRYIMKQTVETKILDIQDGKVSLADGLLKSVQRKRGDGLTIPHLKTLFQ